MGLFDQFPYTNFHELNLDWLLKLVKELNSTVENFIALNTIKYADPIQWNITTQYEPNTIVIDPLTGTAYLSTKPVPAGVSLSNEEYWTVVFDLSEFITRNAQNFTDRIESETTSTATFDSAVGQWIIWGDTLYHAISPITTGDAYVIGSNIEHITMENLYNLIINMINNEATARSTADAALQSNIDNEATARSAADAALQSNIDSEAATRSAADTAINNKITSLDPYEKFRGKTIEVIGDSISAYTTLAHNWVYLLTEFMAAYNCTVINRAIDGDSFAGLAQKITAGTYTVDAADYYIVFLGTNYADSWGYTTGSNPLAPAITTVCNAIRSAANTDAKFFFVSPLKKFMAGTNDYLNPLPVMRNVLELLMQYQGYNVISGYNIGELCASNTARYLTDLLHPTEEFSPILFKYILDGLVSERSNITQPAAAQRTFSNTLSSSSNVFIRYDGLHIVIKIDVNGYSPTVGDWVDICNVPTFLDDQPFPFVQTGAIAGATYQYRIQNNKLQAYYFTAPSTTFKDVVDFYITANQNC